MMKLWKEEEEEEEEEEAVFIRGVRILIRGVRIHK